MTLKDSELGQEIAALEGEQACRMAVAAAHQIADNYESLKLAGNVKQDLDQLSQTLRDRKLNLEETKEICLRE
ncbi:MAG: hypothetical protein R3C11_26925 [Planctomycetaceae bacterium]